MIIQLSLHVHAGVCTEIEDIMKTCLVTTIVMVVCNVIYLFIYTCTYTYMRAVSYMYRISLKSRRTYKEVSSNKCRPRNLTAWKRVVGFKVYAECRRTRAICTIEMDETRSAQA